MSISGWENSEGRIAGCLPRASKPGEWCPMFSEKIKVIPKSEWRERIDDPTYTGLWPSVPVTLDQDAVGSCAAESGTGCVLTCRSFHGQEYIPLSPWYLYHFSGGGRDGGSNIDTNLRYLRDRGVATLEAWPRSKGFRSRPSEAADESAKDFRIIEFYDIQNTTEFGSALLQGFPVAYGRSGHAIYAIDLVSEDTFRYQNSWGNWGDRGTAVESLRRINFGYGVWAIRVATDTGVDHSPVILRFSEFPRAVFEPYPIIAAENR